MILVIEILKKALEESKRFNSNVIEGDYFRKNNIVLGNL